MMKQLHRHNLLIACFTYCILFYLLLPVYQWVFDVDGVGYSLVATHLAAGNFGRAINGFWSPLHSWLVAPFMNSGMKVQTIFFCSNALISLVILYLVKQFAVALSVGANMITGILFSSVILLLQFSFFELAADILVLPFILGWLLLVLRNDFYTNNKVQMLCGVLIAFAYFAKTYSLPFLSFIHLALFVRHYFLNKESVLKQLSVFFVVLAIICTPWIVIISNKYGYFTIGNSSRLNLSWFLKGVENEQNLFQAPHYSNSPGWWEDPSYYKGELVNMFSSGSYLLKQMRVFFYNITLLLKTLMDVSAFAPALIFGVVLTAFKKKEVRMQKLSFFLLLFPLGYLLTFVESRYLWIFNLVLLAAGVVLLQRVLDHFKVNKIAAKVIYFFYFLSFLLQPVNILKDYVTTPQWKEIHEVAAFFSENKITPKFTSNKKSSEAQVVAYLSGATHYQLNKSNVGFEQLTQAMQQNNITHLLFFYEQKHEKEAALFTLQQQYSYTGIEIKHGVLLFSKNK